MIPTLPLSLAAVLLLPSIAPAQTLLRSIPDSANQPHGSCAIRAGDQHGDGFEDAIVGAPGHNEGRGAVFCISGSYLALGSGPAHLRSITPTFSAGSEFGASLALAGNLTGDSAVELVIGVPGERVDPPPFQWTPGPSWLEPESVDQAERLELRRGKPCRFFDLPGRALGPSTPR